MYSFSLSATGHPVCYYGIQQTIYFNIKSSHICLLSTAVSLLGPLQGSRRRRHIFVFYSPPLQIPFRLISLEVSGDAVNYGIIPPSSTHQIFSVFKRSNISTTSYKFMRTKRVTQLHYMRLPICEERKSPTT